MGKSPLELQQDWNLAHQARTAQREALYEDFRKTVILSALQPEDQNAAVRDKRLAHVGANLAEAMALQR